MLTIERAKELRRSESGRVQTPWGISDDVTHFAEGIWFYTTPSHGGFRLSAERLLELPEALRKTNLNYCGAQWFEEDCEASLVVVGFPDHFTGDERARALEALRRWYPTHAAAYEQSAHARAPCGVRVLLRAAAHEPRRMVRRAPEREELRDGWDMARSARDAGGVVAVRDGLRRLERRAVRGRVGGSLPGAAGGDDAHWPGRRGRGKAPALTARNRARVRSAREACPEESNEGVRDG
jgi:hypothetical protein